MNFFKDHLNLSNNIYDNAKILKATEIKKQQEVVDRNPTTKYYQTLALNLQEQVQYLTRRLNESNAIVPTVFHRDEMSPEDLTLFGNAPRDPSGANNPNGRFNQWNPIDHIIFTTGDLLKRFFKYIVNNPREFSAEVVGSISLAGRQSPMPLIVSTVIAAPELIALGIQVFGISQPAFMALLNSISNGSASASDIAAFQNFWYFISDTALGIIPNIEGYNLNAGAGPGRPGDSVYNSGDGTYRGQRGGNLYQPPLPR